MLAAPGITSLTKYVSGTLGGASGWLAGIGASSIGNGTVGMAATFTTNWLSGKPDMSDGLGKAFLLNAAAPLISAEAPILAAGVAVGEVTETVFGMLTNTVNLVEAYLPGVGKPLAPTPTPHAGD